MRARTCWRRVRGCLARLHVASFHGRPDLDLTCFLIYVTSTELSALLGEGQMFRLSFPPSCQPAPLTRRQHVRALMEAQPAARDDAARGSSWIPRRRKVTGS